MTKSRLLLLVLGISLAVALAACDGSEPAAPEEPFEGSTAPSSLPGSPNPVQGAALLIGVSSQGSGTGGAYDRLHFNFDGNQRPNVRVEYVQQASQCGSGEVVTLPGRAVLVIAFEPANAHDDNGRATIPVRQLPGHGGPVQQLQMICDFEAHVNWAAGIDGMKPFRIVPVPGGNDIWIDIQE